MSTDLFPKPWAPRRGPGRRGIFYVARQLNRAGLYEYLRKDGRALVYRSKEEAEIACPNLPNVPSTTKDAEVSNG